MKSNLSIMIGAVSLICLISCKKNNDANPIAEINSAGRLVKIAGGDGGYADGLGSSAKFETISFITIDQNGDIILTDGERIRRVKKN